MKDIKASSPSLREKCLNLISNAASQWKLMSLVLAWLAFALTGCVLILLVLFQYIQLGETNQNSAVVSSLNVAVGLGVDELAGIWDVNLYLNKNIKKFDYKVDAKIYYDGNFVSRRQVKGQGSLVRGNFLANLEKDFSFDKGVTFDLFMEVEVTIFSKLRWVKEKTMLTIDCNDLKIEFPINTATEEFGKLSNGPTTCTVQTSPRKFSLL